MLPGFTADASLGEKEPGAMYWCAGWRVDDPTQVIVPARSCSSRDGQADCFCNKGCRRTRDDCSCPND
jgi:hypothetical protein